MAYLCSETGSKVSGTKIKTIALLLLASVVWHQCSGTLFSHTHYLNGRTVAHSHPYTGTSGSPNHSHTSVQFATIALLSSLTAVIGVTFFTAAPAMHALRVIRFSDIFRIFTSATAGESMRGPPATALFQ